MLIFITSCLFHVCDILFYLFEDSNDFFLKLSSLAKNPCFLQIAVLFFHLGPPPSAFRPIFQVRAFPLMSDDLCRSPHIRAWDTKCRLESEGMSGA